MIYFVKENNTQIMLKTPLMYNKGEHVILLYCCLVCFSKLQSFLLQQQTFLEKCETWMEFLVQTEENLAVEISGNYQSLMEQQKTHEVRVPL